MYRLQYGNTTITLKDVKIGDVINIPTDDLSHLSSSFSVGNEWKVINLTKIADGLLLEATAESVNKGRNSTFLFRYYPD